MEPFRWLLGAESGMLIQLCSHGRRKKKKKGGGRVERGAFK